MPLARILTRFPEQANALSQELRQHGYTVEFSKPEAAGTLPADLEIDFEICAEPDALERATELADEFHADVAISPGVLKEFPVARQAASEVGEPVLPASAQETNLEPAAISSLDIPRQEEDHIHEAAIELSQQGAEPEPLPPNVISMPVDLLAEPAMPPQFSALQPEQAQQNTPLDDEIDLMRAAPASEARDQSATELLAELGKRSATLKHAATEAGQQIWHRLEKWTRTGWISAQRIAEQGREQLNRRKEQFKVQRQQKVLEFERKQALAQERAAELEAAREAAATRLQQLLRERGGLTDSQPVPPQKTVEPAPMPAPVVPSEQKVFVPRFRIPFSQTHRPQVEAVAMGVAAACALFVVGLVVASFHARPAISGTVQTSSSTQPASPGVTVKGGGVTLKAGEPASSGVTLRPSAPVSGVAPQKPTPTQSARVTDVTIRNVAAAHKPTPHRAGNSERIGDDVVIRHFGTPVSAPTQSAPRAQLKHYSDLDN
jgi:hypothetical protein